MKSYQRASIALLISIGFAAMLSIVPKLDRTVQTGGTDAPVFRADYALTLSDRNLVDLFVRYPLHLDISHVEWNDTILSVDLKSKPNATASDPIYDDLYELARLGFAGTKNVKQLLIRVMEYSTSGVENPQLLLAMDAKRSDLSAAASKRADMQTKETKEQFLSSHFSLTYTHKWLDRHRR
ncbi:MAG: hypothetical protein K0R28_369 [Paenibacillus sp.]|nr:hypothetical protein [Paenibacillus sp.]